MTIKCPHCRNDDQDMFDKLTGVKYFCNCCAHVFKLNSDPQKVKTDDSKLSQGTPTGSNNGME